jgi:hypothetical protein
MKFENSVSEIVYSQNIPKPFNLFLQNKLFEKNSF